MGWFNDGRLEAKKSIFRNLAAVAVADGKITEEEKLYLISVGQRLGLQPNECKDAFVNPFSIKLVIPSSDKEKILQLVQLVMMMLADGEIHPKEFDTCSGFAIAMGFDPLIIPNIINTIVNLFNAGKEEQEMESAIDAILKPHSN